MVSASVIAEQQGSLKKWRANGVWANKAWMLTLLVASSFVLSNCASGLENRNIARLPVQVGGEAEFDACPAVGRLTEDLRAQTRQAGTLIPAYERPDYAASVSIAIGADDYFWMCDWFDEAQDGVTWTGILRGATPETRTNCGVSGTIAERRDYDGPCQQGWLRTDSILLIAG